LSEPILKVDGKFWWYVRDGMGDDSNSVAGTLEIAANGTSTLSLVGLLSGDASEGLPFVTKPIDAEKCIFGALKDGSYVFLARISHGGMTLSNVLSHQGYQARDAIIFHRLQELPDLKKVTRLQIGLDTLGDWASDSVVTVSKTPDGAEAHGSEPEMLMYSLPGKTIRQKTTIRYTAPAGLWFQSATIKQENYWEVEPGSPLNLDAVRDEFHALEDLLLLIADVDVALPWPTVRFEGEAGLYYFERRRSEAQKIEDFRSWAKLAWLKDKFGTLLANFEAQRDVLGPSLYLYLGIRRSSTLYLENRFSTAIFGLESLHRRVGTSGDQTKLEEKIARIIDDVKLEKDRKWLSGRLKNASEPNLEERLFLTFSELDIDLKPEELRNFSKECANLRNQVAHFGGQRDGGYDTFIQKMYVLNEAVRPLYHAVLLNRIGFDSDKIWAYFHRSPHSRERKLMLEAAGLVFTPPPVAPADKQSMPGGEAVGPSTLDASATTGVGPSGNTGTDS